MCLCKELENTSLIVNIGCDKTWPVMWVNTQQNLPHKSLENAWSILQAKWHDSEFEGVENAVFSCESRWTNQMPNQVLKRT